MHQIQMMLLKRYILPHHISPVRKLNKQLLCSNVHSLNSDSGIPVMTIEMPVDKSFE